MHTMRKSKTPADYAALATIGKRLELARDAWGLKQEDVARIAGISRAAYGYWEAGKNEPSPVDLAKVAEFLCVTLDWLITGKGDAPAISPDKATLRRMIRTAQERLDNLDA